MQVTLKKPLYINGEVELEGASVRVNEQRGRELVAKGYAAEATEIKEEPKPAKKAGKAKAE